jgi:hypothetical protein
MPNPKTVMDIIRQYLRREGYDGLVDAEGECGCLIDDLAPCESDEIVGCRPGYKYLCRGCEADCCQPGPDNWHVSTNPHAARAQAEPEVCANCRSRGRMTYTRAAVGEFYEWGWICDACGHDHIVPEPEDSGTVGKEGK